MYKRNDICYYIENNARVRQGVILSVRGGMYTVMINDSGAIRLPEKRLYRTANEAAANIPANATIHPPMLH